VVARVQQDIPALGDDRYLSPDLERAAGLIADRTVVEAAGAVPFMVLGDRA
jgi:histidine ammonia-lyase